MLPTSVRRKTVRSGLYALGAVAVLPLLSGCPSADSDAPPAPARLPFEGQRVRLLVVDDPAIAAAVGRLAGEWKARSGAAVEIAKCTQAELAAREALDADAIVYPAGQLGMLAERGWLRPLSEEELAGEAIGWTDVFAGLRDHELAWGGAVHALPLGSPVLVCHYRADLLKRFAKSPPRTWGQYQELAVFFADRGNLGDAAPPADGEWSGAAEPLAPGWAGLALLARAAAYARHPYFHSTLFDLADMTPLIDQPPLVRGLEELVAARRAGPPDAGKLDPQEVRRLFWSGGCALALTWTTAADASDHERTQRVEAGFCELPGATEVYHRGESRWEPVGRSGEMHRVTLLAIAGRQGSVANSARHPEAALALLSAICGPEWATQVAPTSAAADMFRRQHVQSPRAWTGRQVDPLAAQQYSAAVESSLSRSEVLAAPQIPGRDEYLAALDDAVAQALDGTPPDEALRQAAARWREITQRYGIDAQQRAYEHSLGR